MTARRIAITGGSGLIGSALSAHLTARGDAVLQLVRRPARSTGEVSWDPAGRQLDPSALDGVDAVVHLAGAGVMDRRWSPAYKQQILASRVDGTTTIAEAVAAHGSAIRLVSGSAIGFYGSRGDEVLTEASPAGSGFLTEVVLAWEAATAAASEAGASVVHSRTGLVMSGDGGAFAPLRTLTRFGLGGALGSGRQWWSWITLEDVCRALTFLVDHREVAGPVNLTAPAPARQKELVAELGRQLHRPTVVPAPAPALRVVLGEAASEVLQSTRALPARLEEAGFTFAHRDLASGIAAIV